MLTTSTVITEGNLDGYQKKKYLAKVLFTYILGYKVDLRLHGSRKPHFKHQI